MTSTESIWATFSGRLRGYVGRKVRAEDDVEDILQEVFARIHSGLGSLRAEEKLEAWLFQVTRRAMMDHFRSRSGIRRSSGLPEELAGGLPESDVPKEIASCLQPMMSLVSGEDREILRLVDQEGIPQKDLASRLGVSVTAVKSRVQRARKRLREAVLDCCHVEMDRRGNPFDYRKKREHGGPCGCP